MRISFVLILVCSLVSTVCCSETLLAQPQLVRTEAAPAAAGDNSSRERITVTESFEPSILIEPLNVRLEGRPGDVIPFQFRVEVANRDAQLEVTPIGLGQELSGQIFHNEASQKADLIRLISPGKITVAANNSTLIEGVIRIPNSEARFHSLGLLVRDNAKRGAPTPRFNPDGTRQTQASVQFMTQYLLRIDLLVEGSRGVQGNRLAIEDVRLASVAGRPMLQAIVNNNTDEAFEFELRAKIRNSPTDRTAKPLRLVMPVRASLEDESRYVGRVLPQSRVRMQELLPDAIGTGDYECDLEMLMEGVVAAKSTFPLKVNAADYPAQEVLIAEVGNDLQVSPAQIELSQTRGGKRRTTLLIKNTGSENKSIHLKSLNDRGFEINEVMIQPAELVIPAKGSKKVTMTLRSSSVSQDAAKYGTVMISAKSDSQDFANSHHLPLAVLLKQPEPVKISAGNLRWSNDSHKPSFKTTVKNEGDAHVALEARLMIADSTGRVINVPGGFGKWLMPNSSSPLVFQLDAPLATGEYVLRCEIATDKEPIAIQQNFQVTDFENAAGK